MIPKKALRRASRQHWVLSRAQALADGVSGRMISRAVARGEWRRIYPSVYLVNQARLTWKARLMGAVLWAGPDAVVSHRSAAALLGMKHADKHLIEISSPRRINSRHGIRVHHDPSLAASPNAKSDNIPVTRIAKTVLDLCSALSFAASTDVVLDVVRRRAASIVDLGRVLDEASDKRGGRSTLRRILASRFARGVTDSDAEDLFMVMAARRGFSLVHHFVVEDSNFRAELDFADIPARLDVEIDGGKDHDDPVAQQRDKNRDAELIARGWTVLRFTYWDLIQKTDWMFEIISAALERKKFDSQQGTLAVPGCEVSASGTSG